MHDLGQQPRPKLHAQVCRKLGCLNTHAGDLVAHCCDHGCHHDCQREKALPKDIFLETREKTHQEEPEHTASGACQRAHHLLHQSEAQTVDALKRKIGSKGGLAQAVRKHVQGPPHCLHREQIPCLLRQQICSPCLPRQRSGPGRAENLTPFNIALQGAGG